MKPGYKIIIAALLIYAGFKVYSLSKSSPCKERALAIATFMSQGKSFQMQDMLSLNLASKLSIDDLNHILDEYNLSKATEIEWSKWSGDDDMCSISGEFIFENMNNMRVDFYLQKDKQNLTKVSEILLNDKNISTMTQSQELF